MIKHVGLVPHYVKPNDVWCNKAILYNRKYKVSKLGDGDKAITKSSFPTNSNNMV